MKRIIIIIFTFFSSTLCTAQTLTFSKMVDSLYFGVDMIKASGSLVDSFMNVQQLHHNEKVVMQSSLNLSIMFQTDKTVWAARHIFEFTKSPVPDLKIDSGYIMVRIAEVKGINKLLGVGWNVDFDNEKNAKENFEMLKKKFALFSTTKKYYFDKDIGHVAEFSTTESADKGIKDITLFLSKSQTTKKYQISLDMSYNYLVDK